MNPVYICGGVRTPIGRYGGALSTVRADDLATVPMKALMERNAGADWSQLDEVYLGCANQAGEDTEMWHPLGMSGARLALTAVHQMSRSGGARALATMCIGVGQGIAVAFERC